MSNLSGIRQRMFYHWFSILEALWSGMALNISAFIRAHVFQVIFQIFAMYFWYVTAQGQQVTCTRAMQMSYMCVYSILFFNKKKCKKSDEQEDRNAEKLLPRCTWRKLNRYIKIYLKIWACVQIIPPLFWAPSVNYLNPLRSRSVLQGITSSDCLMLCDVTRPSRRQTE